MGWPIVPHHSAVVATIVPATRGVLIGLLALLVLAVGVLIACVVLVRRRSSDVAARSASRGRGRQAMLAAVRVADRASPPSRAHPRPSSSAGLLAVASQDERMACPTCAQEYAAGLRYCPADARELVRRSEIAAHARRGSSACVTCHRAFEMGVRYCPEDDSELVPIAVYESTRGRVGHLAPVGVTGKICPQCSRRVDLAARFCPIDGTELRLLH